MMPRTHVIALIFATIYLLIVGFVEFPSHLFFKEEDKLRLKPITTTPVAPNTGKASLSYEDYLEKEKAAIAITKKYRRVDYETAMRVTSIVYQEARTHGIDPKLMLALVATESSFNPKSLSIAGAKGYTQVIPKWHRDKIKGRDIWNVAVNIEVGVKVLKDCFRRNKTEYSALACYNGAVTPDKAVAYKQAIDRHKTTFLAAIGDNNRG